MLLSIVVCPVGNAWATHVPAGFSLDFHVVQGASSWTGTETSLESNLSVGVNGNAMTLQLIAEQDVLGGDVTITSWDSTFDPDPYVTNNFVVVNNSAMLQTYTVSVSSPVVPDFLANRIIESNIILTINNDDNLNGASVSSVTGTPVYEAFINGGSAMTFLPDPFSNSCTTPTDCVVNGISVGAVESLGIAPTLVTSIGITTTFTLSPGDSAAIQSRFEVVPEPGTATLFALGLLALGAGRRRRGD